MLQYGSCYSSPRSIKNTKAKNCQLKKEYIICLTSDRPVRYSYPHVANRDAGYYVNGRSNAVTSVREHHLFFQYTTMNTLRNESLLRGSRETRRSRQIDANRCQCFNCNCYSFSAYNVGPQQLNGWRRNDRRGTHILFSRPVCPQKEWDGFVKHEGVWLDGYNCGEKFEFETNSQPVTVNALRAVLRRFAVRRLNYTAHGIQIDYRAFLPPKSGVLIDEKRERWKHRD